MPIVKARSINRVLVALLGIALVGGVIWFSIHWMRERQATKLMNTYLQEIISMLSLPASSHFHQRMDKVRSFINDHSKHKIDGAFFANRGDPFLYAAGLIAHAKNPSIEPVHMECSVRSNVMARILEAMGYETRIVAIFNTKSDRNLNSHSFLEVLNPETGQWETQDADYDIYWKRKDSSGRISLADAAEDVADIEPCGRERCGWDHVSREGKKARKLRKYLDIISITDKQRGIRYALYTSRADLSRLYSKGRKRGTFCQTEAQRCKQGFYDIRIFSSYAAGQSR
jgi:hypothetical protein